MDEERLFVAKKLAYRPRVVYTVLLFCRVSWRTSPDISRLAEEMASTAYEPRKNSALGAFLKYLYRDILCTGHTKYVKCTAHTAVN